MRSGIVLTAILCLAACAPTQPKKVYLYDENGQLLAFDKPKPQTSSTSTNTGTVLNNRLTEAEVKSLRDQLSKCWSIQAGKPFPEDLPVELQIRVSPKRHVISAVVLDEQRYDRDPRFREAANSALHALASRHCKTLNLNPSKYDLWKDMIVTFDPREMI